MRTTPARPGGGRPIKVSYRSPEAVARTWSQFNLEPLGDLSADLEAGRRLGPGGFVALDFETATNSRASACAVAVAAVDAGRVVDLETWLIRPPDNEYDPFLVGIHGITPEHTAHRPSIDAVWPEVARWMNERPVVAHYAPFDLSVLRHSLAAAGRDWPDLTYYCTCALGRRAWPGRLSYRLPDLASECGLAFEHHEPGGFESDPVIGGKRPLGCLLRVAALALVRGRDVVPRPERLVWTMAQSGPTPLPASGPPAEATGTIRRRRPQVARG